MRYHFFLHYGWFFQNLGKEAVRTFMHTTVCKTFSSKPTRHLIRKSPQLGFLLLFTQKFKVRYLFAGNCRQLLLTNEPNSLRNRIRNYLFLRFHKKIYHPKYVEIYLLKSQMRFKNDFDPIVIQLVLNNVDELYCNKNDDNSAKS